MSVRPSGVWPEPQPGSPAPLDQPQYDATIGQAAARFWRKFATFSGRASRSEYWWWVLISVVISVVLQMVGTLLFSRDMFLIAGRPTLDFRVFLKPLIPALIWTVIVLVPSIALVVRRLHDTNRSGWWYLLSLPSYIGLPFQMVGLASIDPNRVATGDFGGVAVGPLVAGGFLTLIGMVGGITMLVFLILGPDPRGARFDRRP